MKIFVLILFMFSTPLFAADIDLTSGDASILADLENTTLGGADEQTFDASCIKGNCENGLGTFMWDNGDQYEGAWKDSKPHGEGTFDWCNRIKYVGEWRDGKKHGQGTTTFPDGSKFVGGWKDGKKHGRGTTSGGNMGNHSHEWKDGVRYALFPFEKEIKFINPKDDKKGRSLIDRPDTNDDYKIHVMYILPKESKDKEMDINGKLEKMVFNMDDLFFKSTSDTKKNKAKGKDKGHRLKLDLTKEDKLDITFVRLPWTTKEMYKACKEWREDCPTIVNFITDYLAKMGLFEPKKTYSILFDIYEFGSSEGYWGHGNVYDPGVGYAVPWGYTYYKGCARDGKKACIRVMLHELIHSFGFTKACHKKSKKDDPAHQNIKGDIMGEGQNIDHNNESYYLHGDPKCRDLADVVYLIPTSSNWFDPAIAGWN